MTNSETGLRRLPRASVLPPFLPYYTQYGTHREATVRYTQGGYREATGRLPTHLHREAYTPLLVPPLRTLRWAYTPPFSPLRTLRWAYTTVLPSQDPKVGIPWFKPLRTLGWVYPGYTSGCTMVVYPGWYNGVYHVGIPRVVERCVPWWVYPGMVERCTMVGIPGL